MTVVYNEVMIAKWINEQEVHQQNISILQDENLTNQPIVNQLDVQLAFVRLQISKIEYEIDREQNLRSQGFFYLINLPLSYQNLSIQQTEKARLECQRDPLRKRIQANQIAIVNLYSKLEWLKNHISAAKTFLRDLSQNPDKLVQSLVGQIMTVFNRYGNEHPANLPPQVRFYLYDIANKILQLTLSKYDDNDSFKPSQIHYLRLCGFLWAMHSQVQGTDFAQKIAELLEHTHIDAAGDLPFEPQTGCSAAKHFTDISSRSGEVFSFSEVNLAAAEKREFLALVGAQSQIHADSPMRINIKVAVELIQLSNPSNDYFFYTKVMQSLNALSNNPNDAAAASNLCLLANSATGNPQVGKQVCGALLAIAGLLVISASMAALVTTFAAGAPLCAYGMALGYSLLQVQITCGIGWGVTTAGGIAMASSGIHLFSVGKRHGLSKELNDIGSDAKASNLRP